MLNMYPQLFHKVTSQRFPNSLNGRVPRRLNVTYLSDYTFDHRCCWRSVRLQRIIVEHSHWCISLYMPFLHSQLADHMPIPCRILVSLESCTSCRPLNERWRSEFANITRRVKSHCKHNNSENRFWSVFRHFLRLAFGFVIAAFLD